MKKVLIGLVLVLALAVGPAVVSAQVCPDYTFGYRGTVFFCLIPGLNIPAIGAIATVDTPEGQVCSVPVGFDGTYECKITTSNCPAQPFYSYSQTWGSEVDLAPSFLGVGIQRRCSHTVTFLCCCPHCYQEVVNECSATFYGPCCQ